jgi:chorismate mutase
MFYGVRGATTVSENQTDEIREAIRELLQELLEANKISAQSIFSVFFTVTSDITALNPAQASREVRSDWNVVPLICAQEPTVVGMLPQCIRILIQWESSDSTLSPQPVYLRNAKMLRPDL